MKTLLVYYSHEGNIRTIANRIRNQIECDIIELTLKTPYPEESKLFVDLVRKEIKEDLGHDFNEVDFNLGEYDTLIIGCANWGKTIVPVVKEFLRTYNFSGYTIYPFFSHGGTGLGGMEDDIRRLSKSGFVKESLLVYQVKLTDEEIKDWIKK